MGLYQMNSENVVNLAVTGSNLQNAKSHVVNILNITNFYEEITLWQFSRFDSTFLETLI
jgi:hypothetical protein